MEKEKETKNDKAALFKRLYGVKPDAFEKMLSILQKEYDALRQKGGKPPKLTVEDKLDITLKYLRERRTMDSVAAEYGVCKGAICLSIQWVEDVLVKDGAGAPPGKKALKRKPDSIQRIAADDAESRPINRPNLYYTIEAVQKPART
ncbi:MAG: transposase family protein [Treponema sp.]|jgi:transposase-like protein|nr:transposase family protein [Treponema sp.]